MSLNYGFVSLSVAGPHRSIGRREHACAHRFAALTDRSQVVIRAYLSKTWSRPVMRRKSPPPASEAETRFHFRTVLWNFPNRRAELDTLRRGMLHVVAVPIACAVPGPESLLVNCSRFSWQAPAQILPFYGARYTYLRTIHNASSHKIVCTAFLCFFFYNFH
jgi:hypothetical protein